MSSIHLTDIVRHGEREKKRLQEKIKEKVKQGLKQYVTDESFVGQQGKKYVRVPIYGLRLPRFEVDPSKRGGVGQGDGKPGQPLPGQGQPQPGQGQGQAGNDEGEHQIEVDVNIDEMLDIIGETLELPNIQDKGKKKKIISERIRYDNLRKVGPEATLDIRRTIKNAITRSIACGLYDPLVDPEPVFEITKDDKRHKVWEVVTQKTTNAVIIAMMDISGSMGEEQKEIVRTEMFWLESWLKRQYNGLEIVYIVHDTKAQIVDQEVFYNISEGGGTNISSAYQLCKRLMETTYDPKDWNIYPFHFSDGDNWSGEDDALCIDLLKNYILPHCNQFSYAQVVSKWGSGKFKEVLETKLDSTDRKNLVVSVIKDKEGILDSIKEFLKAGK
ncbi:MAG: DUF444 family protein [Candidatus Cloacimonetes bacterium]|nr:DUF444 family protein [Candidatus Cloacimonadota bacterium]